MSVRWSHLLRVSLAFVLVGCAKPQGDQPESGIAKYWHKLTSLVSAPSTPQGAQGKSQARGSQGPVPVRAGMVLRKSMPVEFSDIGSVEARSTIAVKAQVSGPLTKVWFNEGDVVEAGQTLFTIDPQPYEVALRQAQANLSKADAQVVQARANVTRDKSQADNAEVALKRDTDLLAKGSVSREEYDNARTAAEAARANLLADEAAVNSAIESSRATQVAIEDAKLQLGYCTICSPIKGKTGSLLVHQGNLVRASDTAPLVTINETQPIYVTFSLPERHLASVREHMATEALEVQAVVPGAKDAKPIVGKLSFIDNSVTTGTIRLKATFENTDNLLWPGQFVEVSLRVSVVADAIVAPTSAVQTGQAGQYVYVVRPDMAVDLRNVVAGEVQGEWTIITKGLQPDEKVVTDGQLRLIPDASVKITEDAALPTPAPGGTVK